MSWVSSPDSSLTSGWLSSQYMGLGPTGSVINAASAEGDSGAGPLYQLGLTDGVEYYWRVTTAPASGALVIREDGSFSHTGAADGSWPWMASVYANGVLNWTLTITDQIGEVTDDVAYPLAGLSQSYPLAGDVQTYPLAGLPQT